MTKTAANKLLSYDNVLILTHANPDGDTLGSARALALALISLGKRARVENGDIIPQKYAFLMPEYADFEPEAVVAVDTAAPQMLCADLREKYADRVDLVIDHHGTNALYGKFNLIDPKAAACGEIIYSLLLEMNCVITPEIARALYTAVSTDTGCFRYGNTTADTHMIAARLIELAGDVSDLNFHLFTEKSAARIQLEACVYSSLELHFEGKVSLASVTLADLEKSGASKADRDDLSDLPRTVYGVEVGVLFKENMENEWRVSVRTNGKTDAAAICASFGGGGHFGAAGCTLFGTYDEAKSRFLHVLEGLF